MALRALADNVILSCPKQAEKTESGIFLPGATGGKIVGNIGVVHSYGPDVEGVKLGDEVIYVKSAGLLEVDHKGESYLVVHRKAVVVAISDD